jgi:Secretion system C-terminal sorting domain
MKKIYLSLLLVCAVFALANAQKKNANHKSHGKNSLPITSTLPTIAEDYADGNSLPIPVAENRSFANLVAGPTTYDLQSNNSMARRIHNWGNGVVSATWTTSFTGSEALGFADRGTGYNKIDPATGAFGPAPTARIEGTTRTGFASYFVTDAGEEWVFSHAGAPGAYKIHYAHKSAAATNWIQGDVPITSPKGGLWARACAGGANGNTIHVIYSTTPLNPAGSAAFGGELVNGLDGTLRYCRSSDGGATWDIIDKDFPELNSNEWLSVDADTYQVAAEGNTVAISLFSFTNDGLVWKSTNNGSSFAAARVVNDFPLSKWTLNDGYTFDQLGAQYDSTYYPNNDSLAIFTTDETSSLLVDANGMVHLAYGSLFINDAVADSAMQNNYNWYPEYDFGIIYWNDTMPDNAGIFAADSPDINGDGAWGSPDNDPGTTYTAGYGDAFSTGPSLGIGADGALYMSYIANHELHFDADGNWLHQPFVVRTAVGDVTQWGTPKPLFNEATHTDLSIGAFEECYFATMAEKVDGFIHVLYQQDFAPGIALRTTAVDPLQENSITYIAYPIDSLQATISTKNSTRPSVDFTLSPNPAQNSTRLTVDMTANDKVQIEVYDVAGARVSNKQLQLNAGKQSVEINTAALPQGIYFVKLLTGDKVGLQKLVKS